MSKHPMLIIILAFGFVALAYYIDYRIAVSDLPFWFKFAVLSK